MKITSLFADKPYSAVAIAVCFGVLLLLPWLHLLSPDSAFYLSAYWITLIGKIMCLALVALALDLVWGYAGILSLGHGLYFALGGYAFGMYLMRQSTGDGLPDFMGRFNQCSENLFYCGCARSMVIDLGCAVHCRDLILAKGCDWRI